MKRKYYTLHLIMSVPGPVTGDAGGGAGGGAAQKSANKNNPVNLLGYVPTHWDRQIPEATGSVAKSMEATKTPAELRIEATALHQLLVAQQSGMKYLNGDESFFIALFSVPDSNKVKVIYVLGMGTAVIGHVSAVSVKLLYLFGKGGVLGPAQPIVLDAQLQVKTELLNLTSAEVATVFGLGNHTVEQQVVRAINAQYKANVLRMAAIPAYLVWDGFNMDLYAAMVYERFMNSWHDSHMRTHALAFLRTFMIGMWRVDDTKPFMAPADFYGMLPTEARVWGEKIFARILPKPGQQQGMPAQTSPRRPA